MKKLNKIGSLLLAIGLAGVAMAGCGSSTVSKKSDDVNSAVSSSGNTETGNAANASGSAADQKPAVAGKTIIVDVRTVEEWNGDGHSDCTINIPLQEFEQRMAELKGYGKVVLVCRSGGRAGKAKEMLETSGYSNVENLGPWQNVKCQ
jgi:rhodanese-related sulfurtransferase